MIMKIPGNCTMQKLGDYHIININVRCLVIRFDTKTRDFAITTHHCYMLTFLCISFSVILGERRS